LEHIHGQPFSVLRCTVVSQRAVGTREALDLLVDARTSAMEPFIARIAGYPEHLLLIRGCNVKAELAHIAHHSDEVSAALNHVEEAHVHGAEHILFRRRLGNDVHAKRIA